MVDAETILNDALDRYTSEVAAEARAALATMRKLLPGAFELVYDGYNTLAIGFSPGERSSEAIFSIALYPRWVSLFFLQKYAVNLPDPDGLLKGGGTASRHIVLHGAETLDRPPVRVLMSLALEHAPVAIEPTQAGRIVIKSSQAKQRPRRP